MSIFCLFVCLLKNQGWKLHFFTKVGRFKVIFKRQVQHVAEHIMHIYSNKLLMFYHQVPTYRITGDEGDGVQKDSQDLEIASMPPELIRVEAYSSFQSLVPIQA